MSPEDLERQALNLYAEGRFDSAVAIWERMYDERRAAGDAAEAAHAGAMVALNLLCETGLLAPVRAWVGRVRRLVEDRPGPTHALLAVITTYERFLSGDPDGALAPAHQAVALGERFGVDPARGLGRAALARLAIHRGEVEDGIAQLDDLAIDLGAGAFDPLTTGNVFCELICAAQWVGRHDRAREWTEIMERWRHGPAVGATNGRCRVHRAELLRIAGPAAAAEEEALAACIELRPWLRREFGWPLVELGNIRLRRDDLEGAEAAFVEAHARAWSPQPGLALLRLAHGEAEAAAAMIRDEIAHPMDVPWKERPPFGDLRLVPLLAAQSEITAAVADVDTARHSAVELERIHTSYPSFALAAETALAHARVALLAGEPATAIGPAREALAAWAEVGAPYDEATARVVLGQAYRQAGDHELAQLEWEAAAAAFEEFGAQRRAADLRSLAARLTEVPVAAATPSPTASLVREGDRWEMTYGDTQVWLPDLKGVRLLARLLAAPGLEIHALVLAGAGVVEGGLPVLDTESRVSYRRRLAEVEDDLAEAERDHDEARRLLAQRDRDYLLAELSSAFGLGGRSRTTGGTAERARTSVTRSVRYALARITQLNPELGGHLERAVRTGSCCSYRPDPLLPVDWTVVG